MEFIEIGGEKRPFRCGFKTLRAYGKKVGTTKLPEIAEAISNVDMNDIPWLTHACLKDAAKKEGVEFDHSESDVLEWFDDEGFDLITSVFEKIGESIGGKQTAPKETEQPKAETE